MSVDEGRFLASNQQRLVMEHIHTNKRILDIGGGGEGIIGHLYGRDVIAIDNKQEELEHLDIEATKIVMDGTSMQFISKQFDVVTFFFTLMYMGPSEQKACFKEAVRVLKRGGMIQIWDTKLPPVQGVKDVYVLNVDIELPQETISTGYGVLMGEKPEDMETVVKRAGGLGLKVKAAKALSDVMYYVELEKLS